MSISERQRELKRRRQRREKRRKLRQKEVRQAEAAPVVKPPAKAREKEKPVKE